VVTHELRAAGISCAVEAVIYGIAFLCLMYMAWLIPLGHKPQRTTAVCLFYASAAVILISRVVQMINNSKTDLEGI